MTQIIEAKIRIINNWPLENTSGPFWIEKLFLRENEQNGNFGWITTHTKCDGKHLFFEGKIKSSNCLPEAPLSFMKLLYFFSKECMLFTDLLGSKDHETLLKPGEWEFSAANTELFHTESQILERESIVWIMKSMYSLVNFVGQTFKCLFQFWQHKQAIYVVLKQRRPNYKILFNMGYFLAFLILSLSRDRIFVFIVFIKTNISIFYVFLCVALVQFPRVTFCQSN